MSKPQESKVKQTSASSYSFQNCDGSSSACRTGNWTPSWSLPQLAFAIGPHVAPQQVQFGLGPHVAPHGIVPNVALHGILPNVAPQPVQAPLVAAQFAALGPGIAPQPLELWIQHRQAYAPLIEALRNWKSIRSLSLSGSQVTFLRLLPISSICSKLISLDLSCLAQGTSGFGSFVKHCRRLQRLWV